MGHASASNAVIDSHRRPPGAEGAASNAAPTPSPRCLNTRPPASLTYRVEHLVMAGQHRGHSLGLPPPTARSRDSDVREEERDGAGRKVPHCGESPTTATVQRAQRIGTS